MVVSLEKVQRAADHLWDELQDRPWLRGIGISSDETGAYCVKVNVSTVTPEIRAAIPQKVDGVKVRVEAIGDVHALTTS